MPGFRRRHAATGVCGRLWPERFSSISCVAIEATSCSSEVKVAVMIRLVLVKMTLMPVCK